MTKFVLKNFRQLFDKYADTTIFSNFVALSENPNFNAE